MTILVRLLVVVLLGQAALHGSDAAQPATPIRSAVPSEPIAAILDAFRTHSVVAMSEGGHGNEQAHTFRLALIRDPRFAATVDDIVVESGNALYQETIDRFVRGDSVSYEELRKVWQDTTQRTSVWDRPIYEEFYRAVREVNRTVASDRKLRVLLGDPPIDWDSPPDARSYLRSDSFPTSVIEREVIAKKRKALVVYGLMHLTRTRAPMTLPSDPAIAPIFAKMAADLQQGSIVAQLERTGARVFSIATLNDVDVSLLQPDVANWPRPSLAQIQGTTLGVASSMLFLPDNPAVIRSRSGAEETIKADASRAPMMQAVFDAVLYLGPPSSITYSRLTRELCADPAYVKMRVERLTEFGVPGRDSAAAFKAECARVLQQ